MFFLDPHTLNTMGKTGTTLYQHRKEIISSLAKIRRWIKHHNHMIVIFGPGGTGKSTVGLLLSGKPIHEINASEFVESRENEPYVRPGQGIYKIQVAPGQDRYRQYWCQLYAEIAKSNRVGIINVVSYGYHCGNNFQHDYLSASLVTANFKTGKGELLSPTTAGYE